MYTVRDVEPVVEDVLGEPGVLSEAEHELQPGAVQPRAADQQQRQDAPVATLVTITAA